MKGFLCFLIFLAVVIFGTKFVVDFLYKMIENKPEKRAAASFVCILSIVLIPAHIIVTYKFNKKINTALAEFDDLKMKPTEELLDKYMGFLQKYGICHGLDIERGIWFVVNECPAITTAKKTEFRNLLMSKGLSITGSDKNVIDNFKGEY